jgi:hypothetical protein
MRLEDGKYYFDSEEFIHGPMKDTGAGFFEAGGQTWTPNGESIYDKNDLVRKADVIVRVAVKTGDYIRLRNGKVLGPVEVDGVNMRNVYIEFGDTSLDWVDNVFEADRKQVGMDIVGTVEIAE